MTTIIDAVQAKLVSAGFTGIKQVLPFGQDERGFTLHFNHHVENRLLDDLRDAKCEIVTVDELSVYVLVPADWLPAVESDVQLKETSETDKSAIFPYIQARIIEEFQQAGCVVTADVITKAVSNSAYSIHLPQETLERPLGFIRNATGFLKIERSADFLIVTIPSKWEVDAWIVVNAAPVIDTALDETARTINTLRDQVKQLTAANDKLESRVESLVEERDELIEQRDSAIAHASVADDLRAEDVERALEGRALLPTTPCKEVVTLFHTLRETEKRTQADRELAEHLNQGWVIQHMAINTVEGVERTQHFRFVTLVREPSYASPSPLRESRKLVQPVDPSMVIMTPTPEPAYGGSMEDRLNHHRALLQRRDLTWEQKRAEMNKSLFEAGSAAYAAASSAFTPPASPFNKEG